MNKIRLMIVDNHPFMFKWISDYVKDKATNIEVVAYANNGQEAIEKTRKLVENGQDALEKKDGLVILMDIRMKSMDGITATRQIKSEFQDEVNILALSDYDEPQYIHKMIDAGASGYFWKDDFFVSTHALSSAIKAINQGNITFSSGVANSIFGGRSIPNLPKKSDERIKKLTPREIEVLQLVAAAFTDIKIAEKLGITDRGVEAHNRNLRLKLECKTRSELIVFAWKNGYGPGQPNGIP